MNSKIFTFLIIILSVCNSCKKEPITPELVSKSCEIIRLEHLENDSATSNVDLIYNKFGKIEKTIQVFQTDSIMDIWEYDSEGKVIKSYPYYDATKPDSDVWWYKYDNQGRPVEYVYTKYNKINDSMVINYMENNQVKYVKYRYDISTGLINDTITSIYEFNDKGNLVKLYNDRYKKDSLEIYEEYEYYEEVAPASYDYFPSPIFYKNTNLVKSVVNHSYSILFGVRSNYQTKTTYTYKFNSNGDVVNYTSSYSESSNLDGMNFYYNCD